MEKRWTHQKQWPDKALYPARRRICNHSMAILVLPGHGHFTTKMASHTSAWRSKRNRRNSKTLSISYRTGVLTWKKMSFSIWDTRSRRRPDAAKRNAGKVLRSSGDPADQKYGELKARAEQAPRMT